MECPNCGSTSVQKKGKRAGKQRYRCKECNAAFTEGVTYVKQVLQAQVTGVNCPKCGKDHIIRDGKLDDGTQRYQCQSCGLNFSPRTNLLEEIKWNCPYCDGELSYSGYSRKGFREYKCKECGTSCTGDETGKPIKRITQEDKDSIVQAVLAGKNVNKLAEEYKCTPKFIKTLAKPSYKSEKINREQLNLIIRFGIHLSVPVDYMAEYVGCSEHKCLEVLKKYKKHLMSTSPCAT